MGSLPAADTVQPGTAVLRSLAERLNFWGEGGRGIRLLNVGDSIATGAWGISRPSEHAIAVAARTLATSFGQDAVASPTTAVSGSAGLFGAAGNAPQARGEHRHAEWFTSGIGGARIRHLEAFLSADGGAGYTAYQSAQPDLVTVWIGVNDTIHADEERLEDSRLFLRRLLQGLSARDLAVLLIAPNPVRGTHQPGPWRVGEAYSEVFRPLSRELDVPLVEIAPRWRSYAHAHDHGFLEDQVHPTRAGHADVGQLIAAMLTSAAERET